MQASAVRSRLAVSNPVVDATVGVAAGTVWGCGCAAHPASVTAMSVKRRRRMRPPERRYRIVADVTGMKHEIDSKAALEQWLALPSRSNEVVFQGLDLRPYELQFLALDLRGCLFIGCRTTDKLAAHISKFKCISIPPLPG